MSLVLDAGAFIALERNDRAMWTRLKGALLDGTPPVTHAGVIGQVWRGEPRQAQLSKALASINVEPLDRTLGQSAGRLLGASGLSDVIDAAVVLLTRDGDEIVTSDHDDLARLAATAGLHVDLVHP